MSKYDINIMIIIIYNIMVELNNKFNIIIIGDEKVGKTSILER